MAGRGGPRSKTKGANNGPSRQKYWASNTLEKHKVKALMTYGATHRVPPIPLTRAEATLLWRAARTKRMRTSAAPTTLGDLKAPKHKL